MSRLDTFNDPNEYALPAIWEQSESKEFKDRVVKVVREQKMKFFASCWNSDDSESELMWSKYGDNHRGVTIRSNVGRLNLAVESTPLDTFISRVAYKPIDQDWSAIPHNVFAPALRKVRSWSEENEIRLFAHIDLSIVEGSETIEFADENESAIKVPIDFHALCDAVVLGQAVDAESAENIRQQLSSAGYNDIPVEHSKLSAPSAK